MNDSIALGPVLLPTQALLLIVAAAAALGVLGLLRENDQISRSSVETHLFIALAIGVLGARLGWIAQHWQAYADSPWSMLAFRDGGYAPWMGLLGGAIALMVMAARIASPRHVPTSEKQDDREASSRRSKIGASALSRYVAASPRLRLLMPAAAGGLILLIGQIALALDARARQTPLPSFEVVDMAGVQQRLPTGTGRPQVINLWASWCAPCRREMPAFARVQSQRPDIDFVYLNIGESVTEIKAFTRTLRTPLAPILRDPTGAVPERLQVRGYPTTLILDPKGRLQHRRSGELSEASLKALLPPDR